MPKYKLNTEILKTPVQDTKILLLEPQKGHYFELNETSVLIYQGIEAGLTENQIVETLTQQFDIDRQQAEIDFQELIVQFKQNNILLS
jgi:hypothetical protein